MDIVEFSIHQLEQFKHNPDILIGYRVGFGKRKDLRNTDQRYLIHMVDTYTSYALMEEAQK